MIYPTLHLLYQSEYANGSFLGVLNVKSGSFQDVRNGGVSRGKFVINASVNDAVINNLQAPNRLDTYLLGSITSTNAPSGIGNGLSNIVYATGTTTNPIVQFSLLTSPVSGNTFAIPQPVTPGNGLVCVMYSFESPNMSGLGAGWSGQQLSASSNLGAAVYYKVATTSDAASGAFIAPCPLPVYGSCMAFYEIYNVNSSNMIMATHATSNYTASNPLANPYTDSSVIANGTCFAINIIAINGNPDFANVLGNWTLDAVKYAWSCFGSTAFICAAHTKQPGSGPVISTTGFTFGTTGGLTATPATTGLTNSIMVLVRLNG